MPSPTTMRDEARRNLVAFSWPLLRIPALAAFVNPFTSQEARVTPGILPFALWASLRLFKIAPGDFVCPSCGARRMADSAALTGMHIDHPVGHERPISPALQRSTDCQYTTDLKVCLHR